MNTPELLLRGGHVIDPSRGLDAVADVRFRNGRVAEIGPGLPAGAAEVRDVSGCLVTPGLIDLHTHVYWGGTAIGVDATQLALRSATATFVDAGTAGPGNFLGFRRHVIEPSRPVRIVPLLNLSVPGIFAFSRTVMVGESEDVRLLDIKSCVQVAREHADLIVGIKVRVGRSASGSAGAFPLDMALEVAEETGLPLMAHLDHPPPSRAEVMARLRPGDILTHCFRPFPHAPAKPGVNAGARSRRKSHEDSHGPDRLHRAVGRHMAMRRGGRAHARRARVVVVEPHGREHRPVGLRQAQEDPRAGDKL